MPELADIIFDRDQDCHVPFLLGKRPRVDTHELMKHFPMVVSPMIASLSQEQRNQEWPLLGDLSVFHGQKFSGCIYALKAWRQITDTLKLISASSMVTSSLVASMLQKHGDQ